VKIFTDGKVQGLMVQKHQFQGLIEQMDMKFGNLVVTIFLAGLLGYAFCHRAGWVGNQGNEYPFGQTSPFVSGDTVRFGNMQFMQHPSEGLVVTVGGEIMQRYPEINSESFEMIAEPDTTGSCLGRLRVVNDCDSVCWSFLIREGGQLVKI
jgi:hypothetical protein